MNKEDTIEKLKQILNLINEMSPEELAELYLESQENPTPPNGMLETETENM